MSVWKIHGKDEVTILVWLSALLLYAKGNYENDL